MFGLRENYCELVEALLDRLLILPDVAVLLIPHVYGERNLEADSRVCERLYEKYNVRYNNRLGLVDKPHDHRGIKYVIGQCDFFIGSRLHACLAAVSQSVPTVAIAYSDKFVGVLHGLASELPVLDARRLTSNEILAEIISAIEQKSAIRISLNRQLPDIERSILSAFEHLKAFA
jgi:polysaccharide pyruvyl transferase WcaK-like protein